MPILFHDFETRSTLNIKKVGAWRYATHKDTEVLCCAYAVDDGSVEIWTPDMPVPQAFIEAAQNPKWSTSAFNDQFERLITTHIMAPRHGWPIVPLERRRCSQAVALSHALPPALKDAAKALGLANQKADDAIMLRMSKPRKACQGEDPNVVHWHDGAEDHATLQRYCTKDMLCEREISRRLPPLSDDEQAVWIFDQQVNDRGFFVDDKLVSGAIKIAKAISAEIAAELQQITGGAVKSVDGKEKLMAWLAANGAAIENVQKETIRRALTRKNLTPEARRVLELRRDGAHKAAAKPLAFHNWRGDDGRIRGSLKYHAASTGRWGGTGPQPQNLKRPETEDLAAAIEVVTTGNIDQVKRIFPDPLAVVGDIVRGIPCAPPGRKFYVGDFSGVESRVLAWLASEWPKVKAWARYDETGDRADDPYFALGRRLGLAEDKAREVGKTCDLAFGYMGSIGAWRAHAPDDDQSTDDEVKAKQRFWRDQHPQICRYWYVLDGAAIQATTTPDHTFNCNRISFRRTGDFLYATLPSGRRLAYAFSKIITSKYDNPAVSFMRNKEGRWQECHHGHGAYGGIWAENVTSAVARDLLAAAMQRLEAAHYKVVFSIHDEIVCETAEEFGSAEEFARIITALPDWAAGLPLAAKVRNGPRFCKIEAKSASEPPQS
jgi:DNA polymerase